MTCKTCNGEGISRTLENQSPLGSGYTWLEEIIDDCPNCTGIGICPGCDKFWAEKTWDEYIDYISDFRSEDFICPLCGWKMG